MSRTGFDPRLHGFRFANAFAGGVGLVPGYGGLGTRGRAGGMVFAALDYWSAGLPPPTHTAADFPGGRVPEDGSRLGEYLRRRQADSLAAASARQFVTWTVAEDHPTWQHDGVARRTRELELPLLERSIDAGRPVPLGLVRARHPGQAADHHQVLAYACRREADGTARLLAWDPDRPDRPLELAVPPDSAAGVAAAGDAAPGGRWRGLFVQDYTPEEPVYLDLALASGLWVSSPVPVLGGRLVAQFAARNYGDYPARLAGLALGVRGPAGEDLGGLFGAEPAGARAAPLGPGQQRATCRTSGAFGTRPGRYQLLAGYLGEDGAWRRLPAGAPGTAGRVGVTAMPPARRERVRVSFERVTVVDAARLGGKLALRLEVNGRELAWPAAGMVAVEDGASLDVGARFEALVDPGGLLELLVEGGSAGGLVAERLTGPSGWGRGSWAWQSRVPSEPAAGQGRVPGPDWAPGPWTIHLSIDTAPL